MIFADLGVDPNKNFFRLVKKNHVLIDNEITVMIGESNTSSYNSFDITICFFSIVILFQFNDGLYLQFINPEFLRVGFCFTKYDFRCAFDVFFLSFAIDFPLFL